MNLLRAPGLEFEFGPYEVLLVVAGLSLLMAAVMLTIQRGRPFSAAALYLAIGALLGTGVRLVGWDWIDPVQDAEAMSRVAEFAVIVALFGAGVKLDRPLTWRGWRSTVLLLAVAMPLTIAGVALTGVWLLGLSLPAALLLGAILAPTDPVLADDVQVERPGDEEAEDEARFSITAEAGLNDGMAFPFVMLALFAAQRGVDDIGAWIVEWGVFDLVYAVVIGLVFGAVAGRLIAMLTYRIVDKGWLAAPFDGYIAVASILAVYGSAEIAEGYGFLAVFAAGVAFRRYERSHEYNQRLHEFTLIVEKLAELAVLLLLGSLLPIGEALALGLPLLAAVAILLFLVRPLAVLVALIPATLATRHRAFIAWFGIRGIGSVYYLGFALAATAMPEARTLFVVTAAAIVASVFLHGVTSGYLTRRLVPEADPERQGRRGRR